MAAEITYDKQKQVFHLSNPFLSYLMQVDEHGLLQHLYFGKRIRNYHDGRSYPGSDRGFSGNVPSASLDEQPDRTYSKDLILQEYSGNQTGDYREAGSIIRSDNGSVTVDWRYKGYEIIEGKPSLTKLPHSYVESNDEATTLNITLEDTVLKVDAVLTYTIYADRSVITRSVKMINKSSATYYLEKIASAQIDFPKQDLEVISLPGAHVRERQIERQKIKHGTYRFESRRGTSSHHMNPFIALVHPDTTEHQGEAFGVQLVYSGNHLFSLSKDYIDQTRLIVGINDYNFSWQLKGNAEFQTPEVIMVYTHNGLNDMSHTFHHLLRERVARGKHKFAERPIVINNWEATFMDFDTKKLKSIIDKAAEVGVEMFVLDDGWFGYRDDDTSSLGDWYEYKTKFENGLGGIADYTHEKGLKFGLWFEPEMISRDSDLFRQHPDFALQVPNREMTLSRSQYVLDFSRSEIVDTIYQQMIKILDRIPIDYIKWDMNRHLTEVWSSAYSPAQQGEIYHRYVLGLYDLMGRLVDRYPNILWEGCSGGGGRFDAGILYYFPQTWTSDNTDAVARLKIQYGTSLAYPISNMTSHISESPNQQTGRNTSLAIRGDVAMSGVFGYELNLDELPEAEIEQVKQQIKFYKKHRKLIQYGNFVRLDSPFEHNSASWAFISEDQKQVLLFNFNILSEAQPEIPITKLKGLKPDKDYIEPETSVIYGGDELMNVGLYHYPIQQRDFVSSIRYFEELQ
ncbi:alpha-galactosidase [Sporolactobacillus laevolacticus]|uniref:Alpha-galactosidase n=1 Tax=Sporolactobacillus laevolacticus DSM 442 TaxID=1395513 RepID=V6IUU4_9BACL|nr:alpha-galactosidase [Sporolactobacillus laevolacticus]EST10805.1 alpha-galactosidase [Sporolactobacillus laevolacticus DSM 442]